jgi:hypothetical protein
LAFTQHLKVVQISQLGYADTSTKSYEEDHLIPLELGGHPTSIKNLWPEPWNQAHKTDRIENFLNREVCSGRTSLAHARRAIRLFKLHNG